MVSSSELSILRREFSNCMDDFGGAFATLRSVDISASGDTVYVSCYFTSCGSSSDEADIKSDIKSFFWQVCSRYGIHASLSLSTRFSYH